MVRGCPVCLICAAQRLPGGGTVTSLAASGERLSALRVRRWAAGHHPHPSVVAEADDEQVCARAGYSARRVFIVAVSRMASLGDADRQEHAPSSP